MNVDQEKTLNEILSLTQMQGARLEDHGKTIERLVLCIEGDDRAGVVGLKMDMDRIKQASKNFQLIFLPLFLAGAIFCFSLMYVGLKQDMKDYQQKNERPPFVMKGE